MAVLDLAQLSEELQLYQSKTRSWASAQSSRAQDTLQTSRVERQECQSALSCLEQETQHLAQREAQCETRLREQNDETRQLESKLTLGSAQQAASASRLGEQKACLGQDKEILERHRAGVQQWQASQSTVIEALETALSMYRSKLSLQIRRSEERLGELEVIFGDLSREPDSQHWKVGVSIDEQELYQVTSCKPPLDNLSESLDVLNQSKDFSAFVRAVRRQFCRKAET
ncbi:hypothetical protein WJX84_006991 [Apatococcus fuscideae]|uniref:Kinetochore protein SPC25 n=1 Tax=Apatococcus fuscideae TaxID=2026836 RepID=A0AAW1SZA0_9CHLO